MVTRAMKLLLMGILRNVVAVLPEVCPIHSITITQNTNVYQLNLLPMA
jgi:hypothetical protein